MTHFGHCFDMIRRMLREVGTVTVVTWAWKHRGTVLRGVDLASHLPELVSSRRMNDGLTEAKALYALDGPVPADTDVRITGIADGAVTLRGDLQVESLARARDALLSLSEVTDVRTDGTRQPVYDGATTTAPAR